MERRENKKFIPIVKDKVNGSYAYRGAAGEKETRKNIEILKKAGIRERDIDIVPVKETRKDKLARGIQIAGIVCTVIDLSLYLIKLYKEKKKKKLGKDSKRVDK